MPTGDNFRCNICSVGFDNKRFHYERYDFCSLSCMRTKRNEDIKSEDKNAQKKERTSFRKFDCGGAYSHWK